MLGNLLDNACKWGTSRVRVRAAPNRKAVVLMIEDDGSGLTDAEASDVLRPGERMDESMPGYGFGLPITRELAELYGGSLVIASSELGGLKVEITLPQWL
jgi:signal transduction histidine kinase